MMKNILTIASVGLSFMLLTQPASAECTCPEGATLANTDPCICIMSATPQVTVSCPSGYNKDANDNCVRDCTNHYCPVGQVSYVYGSGNRQYCGCRTKETCYAGEEYDPITNNCTSPTSGAVCPRLMCAANSWVVATEDTEENGCPRLACEPATLDMKLDCSQQCPNSTWNVAEGGVCHCGSNFCTAYSQDPSVTLVRVPGDPACLYEHKATCTGSQEYDARTNTCISVMPDVDLHVNNFEVTAFEATDNYFKIQLTRTSESFPYSLVLEIDKSQSPEVVHKYCTGGEFCNTLSQGKKCEGENWPAWCYKE